MNIGPVFSFFLFILLPALFIVRLWRHQDQSFGLWLIEVIGYGSYVTVISGHVPWAVLYCHYIPIFLIGTFSLAAVKSYTNKKRVLAFALPSKKKALIGLVCLALAASCIEGAVGCIRGTRCPPDPIALDWPFRDGRTVVIQGGSHPYLNHHYEIPAQRFAIDIVKLDSLGLRKKIGSPTKNEEFYIYATTIHSPCSGTILRLEDRHPDMDPGLMDSDHPFGNFLAIEHSNTDAIVILAHLKKESLLVKEGDLVKAGDPLAQVGNSGNTSEPHLHIQSLKKDTGDFLNEAEGIPMTFEGGRFLSRNSTVKR